MPFFMHLHPKFPFSLKCSFHCIVWPHTTASETLCLVTQTSWCAAKCMSMFKEKTPHMHVWTDVGLEAIQESHMKNVKQELVVFHFRGMGRGWCVRAGW